ncbi:MAG: efflux RND transporter permease subunit [Bacteroidetes bacterium]|nr:efflux RND transporter permease subunit [Bacteroidota bacterium]MCW5896476.1 efflux RND transporter permease subunit [Bacteroidota bacterium]
MAISNTTSPFDLHVVRNSLSHLLHRPVAVSMVCGAVVLAGLFAFTRLPIELSPSIDFPSLTINTSWGNTSPETVEQFITAPIEEVANTVAGAKNIRSRSSEGRSSVDVEFEQGTDMNFARLELYEKLAALSETFPAGIGVPVITRYVPEDFRELQGFLTFALASKMSAAALRTYAVERIVPALTSIKGVARVETIGGEEREVHILLDPKRVASAGLTVDGVLTELREVEFNAPVGVLQRGAGRMIVAVHNSNARIDDILDLPLRAQANTLLRLRDIATAHDTIAETRSIYRIDGKPSITLVIDKEPNINTTQVADRVSARLDELAAAFPGNLSLTKIVDKSRQMREELENLRREVFFSIFFIWLVLVVALGSLRAPLVLMSSLVISLAGTLLIFWLLGLGLHLLTLAGLVLGFGRVVDDSIVVLDNIQRRNDTSDAGIASAVAQVRLPVIASTITTIGALLPIAFLPQDVRPYFREFGLAVGIALVMSLLVSFTVIPVLIRNVPAVLATSGRFESTGNRILAAYRKILGWCLRWRKSVLAAVVLAFGLPVWLLPERIDAEHLPARIYNAVFASEPMMAARPYLNAALGGASHLFFTKVTKGEVWEWGNETYLVVRVGFPQGTELHRYDDVARLIEREVQTAHEGVSLMTTRIVDDYASVRVDFDGKASMTALPYVVKNRLTVLAAQTGGASISVSGFGPGFYSGGESAPSFYVKVLGYNYGKVKELAEQFKQRLERNPRIAEVDIDRTFGRWPKSTELVMSFDREAVAAHHFTAADIMPWIGSMTRGTVDRQTVSLGGERVPLVAKMRGFDSATVQELFREPIVNAHSETVPLGALVQLDERRVMSQITRENQQYVRWISFEYRGPFRYGDQFVESTINAMPLPHGYKFDKSFAWFIMSERDKSSMLWLALVALVIVFMVTASLYESFTRPLIVILTVPLSLIGLFLAFYWTDTPFGRGGYASAMLLTGIVVSNAILLIDYVAKRVQADSVSVNVLVYASADRLRPIMMTSLTTIGALLPLLLWSPSSGIWYSLALGTIGGLCTSTLLTLVVVPAVLAVVYRART